MRVPNHGNRWILSQRRAFRAGGDRVRVRIHQIKHRLKEDGPGSHFLSRGCRWVQAGGGRLRAVRKTWAMFVSFAETSKFNRFFLALLLGGQKRDFRHLEGRRWNGGFCLRRSK